MSGLIERGECLKNPGMVVSRFGLGVYLGTLFDGRKSLLERVVASQDAHGFALPGDVGRAYRLAALIEFRVAQVYARLASRFADQPAVADFFDALKEEELEHGRLMLLCRYTVTLHPRLRYVPSLRDSTIRTALSQLRSLGRRVDGMSLDEAFEATIWLERGEINTIFGRLLKQAGSEQVRLFGEKLQEVEGHAESVPKRIAALRRTLQRSG